MSLCALGSVPNTEIPHSACIDNSCLKQYLMYNLVISSPCFLLYWSYDFIIFFNNCIPALSSTQYSNKCLIPYRFSLKSPVLDLPKVRWGIPIKHRRGQKGAVMGRACWRKTNAATILDGFRTHRKTFGLSPGEGATYFQDRCSRRAWQGLSPEWGWSQGYQTAIGPPLTTGHLPEPPLIQRASLLI